MIDGFGNLQNILVFGGTDPVALALVDRLIGPRMSRVVLAGEPTAALARAAERIRALGVVDVMTPDYEPTDIEGSASLIQYLFNGSDFDVVVIANNAPPEQQRCERDPQLAADAVAANLTGSITTALQVAEKIRSQGHGYLVVQTNIGAAIPDASNFVYAATQSGLDSLGLGLIDSLRGSGARAILARLGVVETQPGSPATSRRGMRTTPVDAAAAIASAIASKRQEIVYAPGSVRTATSGMRLLPRRVSRRLPI